MPNVPGRCRALRRSGQRGRGETRRRLTAAGDHALEPAQHVLHAAFTYHLHHLLHLLELREQSVHLLYLNAGTRGDPALTRGLDELGAYPFTELPREHGAALEKFGASLLGRIGTLPWREAEQFGNLRRGFEGFKRDGQYAPGDVALFSAVASHYIQDAHQPFHASNNYNGQLTGNTGIHSRFERDLIERFESRLTLTPAAPRGVMNPRDAAFDVLLSSYKLIDPILKADTESAAGKDTYDDDYYERLFTKVRPILEQRLSEAITATAGVIIGAWEQAGRPAVTMAGARPLQRVKKP